MERTHAICAIDSFAMPFWLARTSTINDTPPISGMYFEMPELIESRMRPSIAPGASWPPRTGPMR